jgi:putative copper export protein
VAQWTALRIDAIAPTAMTLGRIIGQSTWGHAWLAEIIALVVLGIALVSARRSESAWQLGALAVIALACVPAFSGHAAVSGGVLPIALDALHVLAAGGWMGTLLVVLLAGLPATRKLAAPERTASMAALVNAFSPVALTCAALIVATGLLASVRNVEGIAALMQSRYGNMLLRKLFFLGVAMLIGLYNWRRARPALAASGNDAAIRRAMWAELAAGALILLFTAYLVAIPTPAELVRP